MDYTDKIGTLTINEAKDVLYYFMKSKHPVLIRGRHGIGKSEIVYQNYHRLLEEGLVVDIIEKRLSQLTDGEMTGLQKVDGDFTQFVPVDWIYEACQKPVVLFLDEIDRALKELAQGVFQLMDSRSFNGMKLHPGTILVAAINGGQHGSNYQVRMMDPAELSRYAVIDVRPDLEEWCEYVSANNLVSNEIIHFLSEFPEHFCPETIERNNIQPCPRSWVKTNQLLEEHGLIKDKSSFDEKIINFTRPKIGMKASIDFIRFLNDNYSKISIIDIMEGKEYSKLNNVQISQIIEYSEVSRLKVALFNKNFNRSNVINLSNFVSSLHEEHVMTSVGNIIFNFMYEPDIASKGENSLLSMFMNHLFTSKRIKDIFAKRSDEITSLDGLDFIDSIVAGCALDTGNSEDAESMLDTIITESGIPRTKMNWEFVIEDGVEKLAIKDMPTWKDLTPEQKEEQRVIWAEFFRFNKKIYHGPDSNNNSAMNNKTWKISSYLKNDEVKNLIIFYKDPNTNRVTWFHYVIDLTEDVKQYNIFEEYPITPAILETYNKPEITQMYNDN